MTVGALLAAEVAAPARRVTYEEFHAWWRAGRRGERVDGEVIPFGPTPACAATARTEMVSRLAAHLRTHGRRDAGEPHPTLLAGELGGHGTSRDLDGPVEMRTRPGAARFPDAMVILGRSVHRLSWERLRGPADLVVEVVTEESARRDRVEKVAEYAASGVPEYWLVDQRPGWGTVDLLALGPDGRFEVVLPDGEGRLWSRVLPGLWVRDGVAGLEAAVGRQAPRHVATSSDR